MAAEPSIDLALSATVIRLTLRSPLLFDLAGATAHALVLELICRGDPALGAGLRRRGAGRPYTVAALTEERSPETVQIRVTAAGVAIPRALAIGVARRQSSPLALGMAPIADITLVGSPRQSPWAGATSVARLLREASGLGDSMTLILASPVLPSAGVICPSDVQPPGVRLTPSALFGAIHERWCAIEGAPALRRADVAAAATKVELRSSRLTVATLLRRYGAAQQREELQGVVGHLTLQLHGHEHERALLRTLALASFYLGVGVGTTSGMGRMRALLCGTEHMRGLYE